MRYLLKTNKKIACLFLGLFFLVALRSRKNRVLIFALYKKEAARLEQFLQRNQYDAVAVHGDKGQARNGRRRM